MWLYVEPGQGFIHRLEELAVLLSPCHLDSPLIGYPEISGRGDEGHVPSRTQVVIDGQCTSEALVGALDFSRKCIVDQDADLFTAVFRLGRVGDDLFSKFHDLRQREVSMHVQTKNSVFFDHYRVLHRRNQTRDELWTAPV